MRESSRRPRRLAARRLALAPQDGLPSEPDVIPTPRRGPGVMGPWRVARRGGGVLLWTLPCMAIQAVCLMLPGRPKVVFARFYWAMTTRLLGLHVQVIGRPVRSRNGRPVVFVSNHSSWLDVPVLGGCLDGCFVSKSEVGGWPLVGTIARLGRTVFVSRQRGAIGRERDDMRERLAAGDNLVLFPEGTTSDGSRVLPFRSSFFAVAESDAPPLVQPVSVVYDRLDGLPTGRASRAVFAWYGDMDIASHFLRFAQHRGLRVSILLHPVLDPAQFASRKALSQAVWRTVADGAATLRQNRPVAPPVPASDAQPQPSYA